MHSIVGPHIGAVNPNQVIGIQINVGQTEAADGTLSPAYATPGSITASIGGTVTGSITGAVLTVSAVLTGSIQSGDALAGSDGTNAILLGIQVVDQISGQAGGTGTYLLNGTATPSGSLNSTTITSASTVLNATAIASGVLQAGQTLADLTSALSPGTLITGQLSGPTGGPGLYSLSQGQTVASEAMTISMALLAQIQPLSGGDLRHMDMLNLQGSHRTLYVNAPLQGGVRVALKGGDLVTLPGGSIWLVNQTAEPWFLTAGFQKVTITLQDGS